MKRTIGKILIILLISCCIFSLEYPKAYATSISDIFTKADEFIKKGQSTTKADPISEDTIKTMSEMLYNVLLIVGIILAVIIGIIIGIKFMTGSISEKAKLKETFIAYVAGCVVVFGAFTIWKVVLEVLQTTT